MFELTRTGDPRDKILADLVEEQRRLETLFESLDSRTTGLGRTLSPWDVHHLQPYLRSTVDMPGPLSVSSADVSVGGIDPSKVGIGLSHTRTAGPSRSPDEEEDGS